LEPIVILAEIGLVWIAAVKRREVEAEVVLEPVYVRLALVESYPA
jgi:hypothetical protein